MNCKNCSRPIHQEGNPPVWYHSDRYSPCPRKNTVAEPIEVA